VKRSRRRRELRFSVDAVDDRAVAPSRRRSLRGGAEEVVEERLRLGRRALLVTAIGFSIRIVSSGTT
jgi:hypothetical protein